MKINGLSEAATAFLGERGLDLDLCARLGLGTVVSPNSGEWLAIPYRVGGRIIRSKFRCLREKRFHQDPKGAEKRLWNVEALDHPNQGALVITEGELDAIVALQSGWRAVAFGDGAPTENETSEKRYEAIVADLAKIQQENHVILAVDGDEPGRRLYRELVSRIGAERCLFITYPADCKDLNDCHLAGHDVSAILNQAQLHSGQSFKTLDEIPDEPDPDVYRAGIAILDDHLGFIKGQISVWTGVPSHGKTVFMNWLAVNLAIKNDWRIAFASFEQKPKPFHAYALKVLKLGKPWAMATPQQQAEAHRWVNDHFVFIQPPEEKASDWHVDEDMWVDLQWVMNTAKAVMLYRGLDMLVIDPWNELEHHIPRNWTETNYIGYALRQIRRMAHAMHTHVAIIAHPRKMASGGIPDLYDINGSANWANKVDMGFTVYRDGNKTQLYVQKMKWEEYIGKKPEGPIEFEYTQDSRKYQVVDL